MWQCTNCTKEIEDDFDICWNCQTPKDGSRTTEYFSPPPEPPELGKATARGSRSSITSVVISVIVMLTVGIVVKQCTIRSSNEAVERYLRKQVRQGLDQPKPATAWGQYSPAGTRVSLQLPTEPKELQVEIPTEVRDRVETWKGSYAEDSEVYVLIQYVQWKHGTEINLNNFAIGSLEGMKNTPGVSNFTSSTSGQGSGLITLTGSFISDNVIHRVNGFVTGKGQNTWLIVSVTKNNSEKALAGADIVLKSVKIDDSSQPRR